MISICVVPKEMFGLFRMLMFLTLTFTTVKASWASEKRESYDSKNKNNCSKRVLFLVTDQESDDRKSFTLYSYRKTIRELECFGYSVSFRPAKKFEDALQLMNSKPPKSIDILLIGGHGHPNYVKFGSSTLTQDSIKKENLKLMKKTGFIILDSCSSGSYDGINKSIAQKISIKVGYPVFAPIISTANLRFIQTHKAIVPRFSRKGLPVPARCFKKDKSQYSDGLSNEQREVAFDDQRLLDLVNSRRDATIRSLDYKKISAKALQVALLDAINMNLLKISQSLIKNKANLRETIRNGRYALEIAADAGHADLVKMMLENNADVDQIGEHNSTAIFSASASGHVAVVNILIEAKANLSALSRTGGFSLETAAFWGHTEVVRALLKGNADVNQVGEDGITAINSAIDRENLDIVIMLIEAKADLKKETDETEEGSFPLQSAAYYGNADIIQALLNAGANPNQANKQGITALQVALEQKHMEAAKILRKASCP